ncbi:MAG: type II secretion system GspH family protein [Defluviitaleaceae bacterium]|nr:type II secretion system GspH family protein [Defluviitaleaceae bacterium]
MLHKKTPVRSGYTLLEVTIALGVWFILSLGILSVWRYAANASGNLIARQNAFENARGAMDIMLMNIQLSDVIYLDTHTHIDGTHTHTNVLRQMSLPVAPLLPGQDVRLIPPRFTFFFDAALPPEHLRYGRLELGGPGNETARHLALVRVTYIEEQRIEIEIRTTCAEPIVLEGSVCVKYKEVVILE